MKNYELQDALKSMRDDYESMLTEAEQTENKSLSERYKKKAEILDEAIKVIGGIDFYAENIMEIMGEFFLMREAWNLKTNEQIEDDNDGYPWWEILKDRVYKMAKSFEDEYVEDGSYFTQICDFSERELKKEFGKKNKYKFVCTMDGMLVVEATSEEEAKALAKKAKASNVYWYEYDPDDCELYDVEEAK